MKKLLLALSLCVGHLCLAQEIQLDRSLTVDSAFSPVAVAQADVAQVVMGQPSPGLLKIQTMATGGTGDKIRFYTHLGGVPTPTHAVAVSNSDIVVTGAVSIGGNPRLFATRINVVTDTVVWTFVEAARSMPTKGLQVLDTGISFVVAAEMDGGFGALGFNPATGAEQWRTTIPSLTRRARVARDGSENVYIVGSKSRSAGGTDLFVRSVTDAGNFRWEQTSDIVSDGVDAISFTSPLVVLGFCPTQAQNRNPKIALMSFDLATGVLSALSTFAPGPDLRQPVMVRTNERIMIGLSLENGTFTPDRKMLVAPPNIIGNILAEDRLPGQAVDGFIRGNRGYFLSRVSDGLNDQAEFSRETDNARSVYAGPEMNDPKGFVLDSLDRAIMVGNNGRGGVTIRRDFIRPIAVDDQFETRAGANLTINDPGVLANDITARGATLSLVTQPSGGTVTLNPGGGFTYLSTKFAHGADTFTYRLTTGTLTSTATVSIVRQPNGIGMELSSTRVKGGTSVTARVIMSGPRSLTPQVLPVSENSSATALSTTSVRVLPGESFSEPFTVFTARVREPVRSIIFGDDGNFSVEELAPLDIDPPFLTALEAVNTTVVGGAAAQFRIVLDAPAPTNGMPVPISDNSTFILVPSTAVVPAGQNAGIFSAPTAVVTSSKTAVVTATSNGITKSVTIAIVGVSLAIDPASVPGGLSSRGTITLTSNAIVNSVFFNVTDNSPATAPESPTAIVPAGTRVGNFNILTAPVTSTRTATITVANGGVTRSASLTVRIAALQSIIVSPAQVRGGNPYAGLVTLDGKAAGAGLTVGLTSANAIVQLPPTLLIPAGNTQGLFVGSTTAPTTTRMIVITAALNGVTRATTIIVTP